MTEGELDINQLSQIQMSGIGERRVEGYGQMCFNDPLLTMELSKLTPSVTEVDTSNDNVK
ncbi:MAG: hypothetical protein D6822_04140 [Cyanobacteria bacterium J149]|nr:MAG: hypothetical protein D6822_04140 [Cyanobacteria bacterium J149]